MLCLISFVHLSDEKINKIHIIIIMQQQLIKIFPESLETVNKIKKKSVMSSNSVN